MVGEQTKRYRCTGSAYYEVHNHRSVEAGTMQETITEREQTKTDVSILPIQSLLRVLLMLLSFLFFSINCFQWIVYMKDTSYGNSATIQF